MALVLIGRAAFVFPLANVLNWLKKRDDQKIEFRKQVHLKIPILVATPVKICSVFTNYCNFQFIIWWAGLMRGAVTVALSYNAVDTYSFICSR